MNSISNNGKTRNFEKTHPGYLGRMVNLFELNIGVSADRLLTDKPHGDGSPVSRSRSDVSSMGHSLDQIEEKVIVSEYLDTISNKKTNTTPVKKLIAQEMCKEVDSRNRPPNLVAKLMGLDPIPQHEPGAATQRNHSKGYPRCHSEIPMSNWEQQNGLSHYVEPDEFKDVYEIWQQSKKSTRKGRHDETTKDTKLAFVRQKFVEAKCLSMDGNLRQSKQFQDALEVLNSNKDLFLKCLQEPNFAISHQLYDLHSIPPPDTKRITVLRPSKMAGNHDVAAGNREEKQTDKCAFVHLNGLEKGHLGNSPSASWKNYETPTQPTRIVVLKPSLGKILDDKAVGSLQSQSARVHGEEFFGEEEDNDNQESREIAKAVTQQMHEKLGRHHRDETLISSVFSNGYVADESSFNRSEIEYPAGNSSDSEAVSPLSRHSWDYINRLGSPFSSSSFSRASYSPESSVCREAKKRLSERWVMMASSGSCQEQRHVRRSSSTLGEMLALSETKKVASPEEGGSSNQESKDANYLLLSEQRTNRNVNSSTINLTRSKSLPVSSNKLGTRLHALVSVSQKDKLEISEDRKISSSKSSLKGKVSSFFSSRNKKSSKENFLVSDTKDECPSCPADIISGKTESLVGKGHDSEPADLLGSSIKASSSNPIFKKGLISPEAELSVSEPIVFANFTENQDQPSPVSVLDPLFEDCDNTKKVFSHYGKPDQHGYELPHAISSNLIDKSPPIGSIARTLSWDDSCMDTASSYPVKESSIAQGTEEGEREWVLLVETLLSVAGLQGEVQSESFLARWHSLESPLNPSLRDKYIDLNEKDTLQEAKRRQKRSMQKLVFDCVNAVLVDVAGYGPGPTQRATPSIKSNTNMLDSASPTVLDEVWVRMSGWFSGDVECGDGGNNMVADRVMRKEVVDSGWVDHLRLEMDNLGKEIEVELLEEIVQEAVVELTGRE
ncbi:uncharacterized protein LOC121744757 isoform X1 [Salvia splendens]|uniref:uncharacterized protein LOC121744757 isoform X1 n=2 Tax=Salvia splendens TaxID=180675 RepID=UPI001C262043|nr:uncharacterized protein LOC121744757 isoform X1 [Salvia splendens]XP_041994314.1 uncharacterized protein LOC121744757 isoform X1 [Salvia splendens]XP_041994316.1 uncharacterized protein LOC121744757 isoform X1 [Salvia splendens]